jgi:hypothetical protein
MPDPYDGQLGTAKDGTPVKWVAALGRAVPVTAAQMAKAPPGPGAGGPGPQMGTAGLRAGAPGLPYLQTPVAGKDQSEASYFRDFRKNQLDPQFKKANDTIATDRRLEGLLTKQKTGGMYALPVVGDAMAMFDPEAREIKALTNRKARESRVPGEGATSDFDARMFQSMVPGLGQPEATNRALIRAERLAASNAQDRRVFADWYHDRFNTTSGMEDAWRTYNEANPIFDPSSEATGKPVLNPKRQSWRGFYGAERGDLDRKPTQAVQDIQRAQPPPKAMASGYMRFKSSVGLDPKAKPGSARNPHIMTSEAQLATVPVGDYAIGPDGTYGRVE